MSTLTGNKISLTYKSLIKVSDNDILTATLQQLSDGLGNNSGVYLNTGGDLKSTGTLEFANFKGTSTSVTINKLVNQADGISSNDNDTSLPTSAAVKDYVDTHVTSQDLDFSDGTTQSAIDLDSQVFSIVGTTNEIDTVASGQQLQIGLPNSITISGTYTGATFSGDLNGTINTATTAVTQAAGNNSTKVATTAYVDTLDAASDLDFSGTSGTGDVNLNTQTFAITGAANQITTAASNQGLVISLLSSGVTLPNNSIATTQSAGDNSTKVATTAYVDVLDAASDLDIAGDSGTGDVNLNTQTFTLSGTTNQVTTAVSGQSATFSLPSTVHRNLQGNVTGNLTGNADTATKWATARNLSLTSEATGTISSVDGTQNVSGAVTLLNSAVTGKVLTGLPTPAAGNIQAGDSILEAFGKLQSQVSSISNGLIFKGSWDADTNTPTLTSGGGEVDSGTTTGQATNKLIQSGQNFNTTITVGDKVINQVDGTTALVTVIDSNTQLSLNADIMLSGEAYTIDASPFIQQGNYYVVNYAGTTNLNGNNSWSIGDWVIADADNRWSKLDHSQVDGQGTIGNLPVFATATTIGDSIVAQSGTALTVTGSLTTTLGASVTGDFAVNTNKFTVNATTGNTVVAGDLSVTGGDLTLGTDSVASNINGVGDVLGINVDSNTGGGAGANIQLKTAGTTQLTINSSSATFAGSITIPDYIYHAGDGDTYIGFPAANEFKLVAGANNIIAGDVNAAYLYYQGGVKLQTTSSGIQILDTGSVKKIVSYFDGDYTSGFKFSDLNGGIWYDAGADDLYLNANHANSQVILQSGGSTSLTLDASNNATFAGDVTIGGKTYPKLFLNDNQGVSRSFSVGTNNETFTVRNETGSADVFTIAGADNAATFDGKLNVVDTSNPDATSGSVIIEGRRDGSANLLTLRARDASAPTSALPNGQGGIVRFQGFDGTDFENMGYIQVAADGQAVGDGDAPSFMAFGTSADGSSSPTERMRIDSVGEVSIKRAGSNGTGILKALNLNHSGTTVDDGAKISFTAGASTEGAGIASTGQALNSADLRFFTGGTTERMRIADTLITFPTVTELRGDIGSNKFAIGNMGDASSQMMVSSRGFITLNTSNTGSAKDATERMRIDSSGNVKVGRSAGYGNSRIQSFIDSTANFATPAYLAADSANMAAGVGGEISFIGKYATGVDDYAFYGGIKGFKENATSGNTACALGFYTRPTATLPSEKMRITSGGNVLIGTSTLGSATAVSDLLTLGKSGSSSIAVNYTDGTSTKWGYIYVNSSKTVYGSFADITFETGSSPTERMRIRSGGGIINQYRAAVNVGQSATAITSASTYGAIAMVWMNYAGNIGYDLVSWSLSQVTVLSSQAISGGTSGRTYTAVSGVLKLTMGGSDTYATYVSDITNSGS